MKKQLAIAAALLTLTGIHSSVNVSAATGVQANAQQNAKVEEFKYSQTSITNQIKIFNIVDAKEKLQASTQGNIYAIKDAQIKNNMQTALGAVSKDLSARTADEKKALSALGLKDDATHKIF